MKFESIIFIILSFIFFFFQIEITYSSDMTTFLFTTSANILRVFVGMYCFYSGIKLEEEK